MRMLLYEDYLISPQEVMVENIGRDEISRKMIKETQVLKVKIKDTFLMKGQNEEDVTMVTLQL